VVTIGVTVNGEPLLAAPPTVTTTLPVVAPLGTFTTMPVPLQVVAVPALVLLKVTVLVLCADPKLLPEIVIGVPTAAEVGDRLVILGAAVTVKFAPLLAPLPTVTTTLPVVAPAGTVTTMLVALQLVTLALLLAPLNITVLVPCVAPKLVPAIVTGAPTAPEVGDRLVMPGVTVKLELLLAWLPTVTTTAALPKLKLLGTVTAMLVALQLVTLAPVLPKFTVLPPCVEPKLVPVIVTAVPTGPEVGDRLVIPGVTVKFDPVLAWPPTVTTTDTLPKLKPLGTVTAMLVALQFVTLAPVLPKFTVLVPCVEPKLVPVMVTAVPTGPEAGDRLAMPGVTVKFEPLLAAVPTVTTTLPVVAPLGTFTTMLVALQLVAVPALVLLKVTVLVLCDAPKLVPVIVTAVPTGPEVGDRLAIPGVTAKLEPVLATLATVTTTDALPKLKPLGTVTTMVVAFQLVTLAGVLPKFTVLVPCVDPKLLPEIVTAVPTGPEVGDRLPIVGKVVTVN